VLIVQISQAQGANEKRIFRRRRLKISAFYQVVSIEQYNAEISQLTVRSTAHTGLAALFRPPR
jgi:hypothetical protein